MYNCDIVKKKSKLYYNWTINVSIFFKDLFFSGNQRRGRGQGRSRQNFSGRSKDVLDFEGEYDFEQANAEFQELEGKLAKIKLSDNEEAPSKYDISF